MNSQSTSKCPFHKLLALNPFQSHSARKAAAADSLPAALYTPSQVDQLADNEPVLAETMDWIRNFLGKPHRDLGRPGFVCPYIPQSLEMETVWLSVVRLEEPTQEQIEEIVTRFRQVFLNLEPRDTKAAINKAIVLIFPDVTDEQAPKLIDAVQQRLKPYFTEMGLMLGEFHQYNNTPGLRNEAFYPLRSPYPMLAIRHMVHSDLPFLATESAPAEVRAGYLKAYLQRLGQVLTKNKLEEAVAALTKAELELGGKLA